MTAVCHLFQALGGKDGRLPEQVAENIALLNPGEEILEEVGLHALGLQQHFLERGAPERAALEIGQRPASDPRGIGIQGVAGPHDRPHARAHNAVKRDPLPLKHLENSKVREAPRAASPQHDTSSFLPRHDSSCYLFTASPGLGASRAEAEAITGDRYSP